MSGLKLTNSIFDTSTDKYDGWDFSGTNIVKDNVATNNDSSGIVDISSNTTASTETNNSGSWWDGIGDFVNIDNSETNIDNKIPPKEDGMFSSSNIGSTLKGGGAVIGALSSIYGTLEQTKFNKEALGMEKDRINRNIKREDQLQKNYQGVWS